MIYKTIKVFDQQTSPCSVDIAAMLARITSCASQVDVARIRSLFWYVYESPEHAKMVWNP